VWKNYAGEGKVKLGQFIVGIAPLRPPNGIGILLAGLFQAPLNTGIVILPPPLPTIDICIIDNV
jgi:hypothetical protein